MATIEQAREALRRARAGMDATIPRIADSPAAVNDAMSLIREWKLGAYGIGDVRMYEGDPYKCCQAHDSTDNPGWNPTVAALWTQYHGTSKETARPWVQPTGAHDMYLAGEYMIWTDSFIYRCKADTAYSPAQYALAWEKVQDD